MCIHIYIYIYYAGVQPCQRSYMAPDSSGVRYACMYVRTYVCIYIYIYICTYMRVLSHVRCFARKCAGSLDPEEGAGLIYISLSLYIYTYIHVCIHVYIYIYIYTYMCICVYALYVYIYIYISICLHMCIILYNCIYHRTSDSSALPLRVPMVYLSPYA